MSLRKETEEVEVEEGEEATAVTAAATLDEEEKEEEQQQQQQQNEKRRNGALAFNNCHYPRQTSRSAEISWNRSAMLNRWGDQR